MQCKDVLAQLSAYVDAELDRQAREEVRQHLESCASCGEAQTELALLKRLVQTKVFRPPVSGGLVGRVFRKTRPLSRKLSPSVSSSPAADASSPRLRRPGVGRSGVVAGLAAAMLLGILGVLTFVILRESDTPLAHAVAVREVAYQFRDVSRDPGSLEPSVDVQKHDQLILSEIRDRTGVTLNRIPRIPDARLIRWETTTILGRQGIRLDYRDGHIEEHSDCERGDSSGASSGEARILSIFALQVSRVEPPRSLIRDIESVYICKCFEVEGMTILCFRDDSTTFHLTTWSSNMLDRLGLKGAADSHDHDSHEREDSQDE